jgi:valyl-tRNA synthetase
LAVEDRWILSRLNRVIIKANQWLENFQFGEALEEIYQFIWGEFCDWYIELAKVRLRTDDSSPLPVLVQVMETSLQLLHPFMPFITEEIWQRLTPYIRDQKALLISPFPTAEEDFDLGAEAEMSRLIEIIHTIRNARTQFKVEPSRWLRAEIFLETREFPRMKESIETLAKARPLTIHEECNLEQALNITNPEWGKVTRLLLKGAIIILPSIFKTGVERERLEKESEILEEKAEQIGERLRDEVFLSKAPLSVIEKERQKLSDIRTKLEKIKSYQVEG